ncbi:MULTISPECIES: hypothetical protein [Mycobacterium simiae complex]|nr:MULTISPECIES: hypothetical protein [Mycobacterium simiae complex]MCV7410603.1 hypothetical protein [Mycobacterium florentinum]
MPRDAKSFIACACMLDTFAYIVDAYVAAHPDSQPAILQTFQETWPSVMELLSNGENGFYSPAALCVLEDPDDVVNRWFVATIIGNVGHLPATKVLGNERVVEAMARVVRLTESAINQFHGAQIDAELLSRRIAQARMLANVRRAAKFVDSKFDSIIQLADSVVKSQ